VKGPWQLAVPSGLPAVLQQLMLAAMAKEPTDRWGGGVLVCVCWAPAPPPPPSCMVLQGSCACLCYDLRPGTGVVILCICTDVLNVLMLTQELL
jgi:hypothetical protein